MPSQKTSSRPGPR